jgi:hypothetical protein
MRDEPMSDRSYCPRVTHCSKPTDVWTPRPCGRVRSLITWTRHPASSCTSLSIPARSKPSVRVCRASLALLPQPPHQNQSNTGADVQCARARPRPWRADAQYEGRLGFMGAGPLAHGVCPVASNPVGDLVHAGFELQMTTDDAYFDLHYDRVCTAVWET